VSTSILKVGVASMYRALKEEKGCGYSGILA